MTKLKTVFVVEKCTAEIDLFKTLKQSMLSQTTIIHIKSYQGGVVNSFLPKIVD